MNYSFEDLLRYIPDLKSYVKAKTQSDFWEDIVQDTLTYLFIKFEKISVTDLKGLLINTSNFFINKHFAKQNKYTYCAIVEDQFSVQPNIKYTVTGYNTYNISDELYNNLHSVSKQLFRPFEMKLEGMPVKDIAKELNLNENIVHKRIKRCKEYLKKNVA
jgi:DNA-directed RNA polymerase specialized sigma24 family protein